MNNDYFGHFNTCLRDSLFPCDCYTSSKAREINPMKDKIISELVFDVLNIIDMLDEYLEGNCDEYAYREYIKKFKDKYLTEGFNEKYCKQFIAEELKALYGQILNDLNIEPVKILVEASPTDVKSDENITI